MIIPIINLWAFSYLSIKWYRQSSVHYNNQSNTCGKLLIHGFLSATASVSVLLPILSPHLFHITTSNPQGTCLLKYVFSNNCSWWLSSCLCSTTLFIWEVQGMITREKKVPDLQSQPIGIYCHPLYPGCSGNSIISTILWD